MLSTVTTSTVSTITMLGLGAAIGVMATVFLIVLLVTKELVSATEGQRPQLFGRALDVGIVPLLMSFAVIVVMKVVEVLS